MFSRENQDNIISANAFRHIKGLVAKGCKETNSKPLHTNNI